MTLEDSVPFSSYFEFSSEKIGTLLHVENNTKVEPHENLPAAAAKKAKIANKIAEKKAKRIRKNTQDLPEVTE